MNRGICLNWMPFCRSVTGASLRAAELHGRLSGDLDITALTTSEYPEESRQDVPGVRFRDLAPSRSRAIRFRELSDSWWRRRLADTDCGLWVTDTLPVVRLEGIRTCLTVHDLRHRESSRFVSPSRYLLLSLWMRRSLERADAVIAVSRWGAREMQRLYGTDPSKVTVIPNGVDPGMAQAAGDSGSPLESPYILSVGHLEPRKNQGMLIEAFAGLAGSWQGKLVLAGRDLGTGRDLRKRVAALSLEDRVVFTGAVEQEHLLSLYRHCAVLVCPSVHEGFGITLLEGMVMGRPVVATGIPPHREVGGDAVLWADDSAAMSHAISRVLDDDFASSLVEAGRVQAGLYSWDESASKLESLYRELLSS